MSDWIEEVYKEGLAFRLKRKQSFLNKKSEFQTVEVAESTHHGRVLLNDGCFMLSERDERIYHEMMAHVPLLAHPYPKSVLIIGGGDGGTAREVLRHPAVEHCVLVEIDALVVEACREFIPVTAEVFHDPRLTLRIEDGVSFVKDSVELFDVILVDSTDPNGAAQPLFGPEFYADVARRLSPEGVVVAQGESVFYEGEMQKTLLQIVNPQFQFCSMFNFTNMTYPGGLWSFLWASRAIHPLKAVRPVPPTWDLFYYNSSVHAAAFQLPTFQAQALKPWTKI